MPFAGKSSTRFQARKFSSAKSAGRALAACERALPSPVNQARVIQDVLALGKSENFHVNVIEAFDQPWKRALEGTVGGHWGLLDGYSRAPKFGWSQPVSNHPFWIWQGIGGILFAVIIFGAAIYVRDEPPHFAMAGRRRECARRGSVHRLDDRKHSDRKSLASPVGRVP